MLMEIMTDLLYEGGYFCVLFMILIKNIFKFVPSFNNNIRESRNEGARWYISVQEQCILIMCVSVCVWIKFGCSCFKNGLKQSWPDSCLWQNIPEYPSACYYSVLHQSTSELQDGHQHVTASLKIIYLFCHFFYLIQFCTIFVFAARFY